MKKLLTALLLISNGANASSLKATCDSLQGNSFHYIKEKFELINDSLGSASNPVLTFDFDKKLGNVSMTDALGNRTNEALVPFHIDNRQLSLIGSAGDLPEVFTLYLNEGVLFYSTSKITSPAIPRMGDTPLAASLYAKCRIEISTS